MAAVLACDLDGVVWLGDRPIEGAAAAIARVRALGHRVVFVTNNSYAPAARYANKLAAMGIVTEPADVVTSATAAAHWCRGALPPDARILVHGGPGVHDALRAAGFERLDDAGAEPENAARAGVGRAVDHDAVVCGWHREFDFARLARAVYALHRGARFVATNTDPTYPDDGRRLPGNGALVAAVERAAGRPPDVVAGKPNAPMVAVVRAVCGPVGIMIGDRPSTDGAFADALGWPFGLVLSGVAGPGGEERVPDPAPRWQAGDLGALVEQMHEALT